MPMASLQCRDSKNGARSVSMAESGAHRGGARGQSAYNNIYIVISARRADGEFLEKSRVDFEIGFVLGVDVGVLQPSRKPVVGLYGARPAAPGKLVLLGELRGDHAEPERFGFFVKRLEDGRL